MAHFTNDELWGILDSCGDGIYVCDATLKGIWVNEIFESITGVTRDVWYRYTVHEMLERNMVSDSVVKRVYDQKKAVTILQTYKTSDRVALLIGKPILADGQIAKIVVTAKDVTDIKLMSDELERLKKENQRVYNSLLNMKKEQSRETDELIYASQAMSETIAFCERISRVDSTVLLLGETGVGKDIIARTIHRMSPRSSQPFVAINCSTLPRELLESELFGYAGGAFTGADKKGRLGLIQQAHRGTIFLDEIGDMPLDLQAKLLRVLQDKTVRPVGGTESTKVDVRFVAATNKDLYKLVREGLFREDLYYRLNVLSVLIPPLRQRKEDIQVLANYYLNKFNVLYGCRKYFHFDTVKVFKEYSWPGNVRELQNTIERLVVTHLEDAIRPLDLPPHFQDLKTPSAEAKVRDSVPVQTPSISHVDRFGLLLKDIVGQVEREVIRSALESHATATEAALALGISQPTMVRKMKKYNLQVSKEQ